MNFKKVVALSICAAMVAGMSASTVMACLLYTSDAADELLTV